MVRPTIVRSIVVLSKDKANREGDSRPSTGGPQAYMLALSFIPGHYRITKTSAHVAARFGLICVVQAREKAVGRLEGEVGTVSFAASVTALVYVPQKHHTDCASERL